MRRIPSDGQRLGERRAAVATEMALILPLLVTLVLAAADFGRFARYNIAIANASRAGAQYAAMNNYTSGTYSPWVAAVTQAARQELSQEIGTTAAGTMQVSVTTVSDPNNRKRAQVKVSYPFTTVVNWNFSGLGLPHTMTLNQQTEIRLVR